MFCNTCSCRIKGEVGEKEREKKNVRVAGDGQLKDYQRGLLGCRAAETSL